MSRIAASLVLLGVSMACAIGCALTQVAMIAGINSKLGANSQFSYLRRDLFGIFEAHKRFFPASKLRIGFVASLVILVLAGLGFVLTVN